VAAAILALKTLSAIKEQARIARIGLHATRVAASAATVSAKAARESADTARATAELAETALHLTERADILIDGVTVSTSPAFTGDTVFRIVFKNFGRTRGNRVEISSRLLFVPEIKLIVEDNRPKILAAVLGAGKTLTSAFQFMRECLTEETFERIAQGELVLRFEAEVLYFDVFDKRHHTKCSGTFMPEACGFRVDANQEAD
jgi:hypothetical protein